MFWHPERPDWESDGQDWPHRETSRFVEAAGLTWHVQQRGAGPVLLLIHGTGAATHSWRGLAPLLAERFTVVAPDLPGHGFTDMPRSYRLSLPAMAEAVRALLERLAVKPELAVGHSAGAAILIRMGLNGFMVPRGLVSLNGALLPFPGAAGVLFPQMAKLLFLNPLAPRLFAWSAVEAGRVEKLIRDTGSNLDPEGIALYARLMRRPGHVAGALGMMANWDLDTLARQLRRLTVPLLLLSGENDKAVPATSLKEIEHRIPTARSAILPGLGHLAHEEVPDRVASLILSFAESVGL